MILVNVKCTHLEELCKRLITVESPLIRHVNNSLQGSDSKI